MKNYVNMRPLKETYKALIALQESAGKESTCNVGDLSLIPGMGRSLEKGIATHSSILAWRIPWTVKSMGLQRVRHD